MRRKKEKKNWKRSKHITKKKFYPTILVFHYHGLQLDQLDEAVEITVYPKGTVR